MQPKLKAQAAAAKSQIKLPSEADFYITESENDANEAAPVIEFRS